MEIGSRTPATSCVVALRALPQQPSGAVREVQALLEALRIEAAEADRDGDGVAADDLRRAAVALACRHGAATRADVPSRDTPARAACFGSFSLSAGADPSLWAVCARGRAASCGCSRCRAADPFTARSCCPLCGPRADQASAARSMLTTLSSLRGVLAMTPAAGALVRDGAAYRLLPEVVVTDIALAERSLEQARHAPSREVDAAYESALDLYAGDLLEEEGPAEWVVEPREQWRQRMAGASHELAVLRYRRGQTGPAVRAARRGLAVDRHSDALWRVLVASLRADDDQMAADRAEGDYASLLQELAVG